MKTTHLLSLVCVLAGQVFAQPSQPALISVPGAATVSASGHSYTPLLSPDRRYVVFLSSARNLVQGDNLAPYLDVFRHDLQTGETILISRAANPTGGANADSTGASMSANAQWITFASAASDLLSASDTNSGADIFRVDANTFERLLITIARDGETPKNPVLTQNVSLSDKPHVSANGRWIAFESFATNLTAEADLNNQSDVFLRDTLNNQTLLISIPPEGGTNADKKSEIVAMTPNANYILFSITTTNPGINPPNELYVRDVAAGSTAWVRHSNTIPANGTGGSVPYSCRSASISPDGGFVLYKVEFTSFAGPYFARVHLYDRHADSNILVTAHAAAGSSVQMTPDARFIAYDENSHVFLWDRQTGTRTQVSHATNSHSPRVSDNGSIVTFVNAAPTNTFQIYYRNTTNGQLRRVTQTLSGGASAKDHYTSSITVDPLSEFILFDSAEDNLVANDRNFASDIFMHHIATAETRLISRAHASTPSFTPAAGAGISNFSISADGNRILFFSHDSNLVSDDTNGWHDAFLRDLRTGRTSTLTTNNDGLFGPTNSVPHGILSANGRFALLGLFHPSSRSEFSYNAPASIVRKDLDTGETRSIVRDVRAANPTFPFSIPWFAFSISADGRWVSYPSNDLIIVADVQTGVQTNLTIGDPTWNEPFISGNGRYVLHVKRSPRLLAVTDLLTRQRATITGNYIRGATFSQNSQHVVYGAPSGSAVALYLYSLSTRTSTLVCTSCVTPSISADARFVAYEVAVGTSRQIEMRDMLADRTTLVTRNADRTGIANSDATAPVISADGRFVVYTTKATNLTLDPPNGWNNLYVYDRLQDSTVRITGSNGNTGYGSGSASRPVLASNGRTLVFQSFAGDFVANDFNDTRDLFLLGLDQSDADNDGMPDSWEQTHFSTTIRDGTEDFDQDGSTDLAEYLAGTNPANGQSVFEVLQITSVGTNERQLIWRAEPGKSYRLEYKSNLQGGIWTPLGQIITASASTASALDTTATSEKRFYRVTLVQ